MNITSDDPTMSVVRRQLSSGPKTSSVIAEALRRDCGEDDTPDFIRDSLNVATTCLLELGCRPRIENDSQRVAVEHELRRNWDDVRPAWAEIATTEVLWMHPRQLNSVVTSGQDAYAR